ncbi:MAG: hypothetical protein ABIQ02_13785 [Saprospiraceae bacterium]
MKPMLATEAPLSDFIRYLEDDDWYFQPKMDGVRVLFRLDWEIPSAFGRDGQPINLKIRPPNFRGSKSPYFYDTEMIGSKFHLFDLGRPERTFSAFPERWNLAPKLLLGVTNLEIVPTARTYEEKVKLTSDILAQDGEGIIARHKDGLMEFGVRSKNVIKLKFVKDVDVILGGLDSMQQSRPMYIKNNNNILIYVGNVGTQGCHIGWNSVVTVRYLKMSNNGNLIQPRIVNGPRSDKTIDECTIEQFSINNQAILMTKENNDSAR